MITERTIINALIIGASLFVAPFLMGTMLVGNPWPLGIALTVAMMILSFHFLGNKMSLLPLLGLSAVGNLNFLPFQLKLNVMHVACLVLLFYYIVTGLLLRQRGFKVGKWAFFVPIVVVTMIVIYHDHNFGLRILGGRTEGSRRPMLIVLCVIAYFCGINTTTPPVEFFKKIPLYGVIVTFITSIPFIISTYFPSTAPYFYFLTDSVNVDAYFDSIATTSATTPTGIGRLGVFAAVAIALQLYLVSHFPVGSWWRPNKWWIPLLSLGCLALVVSSGYRNNLFSFAIVTMVGFFCFHTWKSFFLPLAAAFAVLLFGTALSNNMLNLQVNKLPLIVQRSLSFLPANWDTEAADSADASNKWRQNIIDVYLREHARQSPWLGNGYAFNTQEYDKLQNLVETGDDPEYYAAEMFITAKMPHTGWISVYDTVGIIGSVAFVALGLIEMWVAGRFVFRKANRQSPLRPIYIWLLCTVVMAMTSFFAVFGDFGLTFPNLCIYAIALAQLGNVRREMDAGAAPAKRKDQAPFAAFTGAYSNYHSGTRS